MSGDASTLTHEQQAQADADFAAGFDDDTTATPTETPAAQQDDTTQGEKTEQPTEQTAEPAPEYVQLTKAERDELFALREQAQKQFGTAFGKIGGIERRLQELNSGPQVEISQEDIDALKDDFPPLAAALEAAPLAEVDEPGVGAEAPEPEPAPAAPEAVATLDAVAPAVVAARIVGWVP